MGQIYNYICLNCQTGFQSINEQAKYCSRKCFSSHRKGKWKNPNMTREIANLLILSHRVLVAIVGQTQIKNIGKVCIQD